MEQQIHAQLAHTESLSSHGPQPFSTQTASSGNSLHGNSTTKLGTFNSKQGCSRIDAFKDAFGQFGDPREVNDEDLWQDSEHQYYHLLYGSSNSGGESALQLAWQC